MPKRYGSCIHILTYAVPNVIHYLAVSCFVGLRITYNILELLWWKFWDKLEITE